MSTAASRLRVTDFERAPWLPVEQLAKERAYLGEMVARAVDRGVAQLYATDAHDVVLMSNEDRRVGAAYREAYVQALRGVA